MLLASLSLLLFQSGGVEQALAEAAALAQEGAFTRAMAALESAGADKDPRVLTARGTYMLRDAESKGASGALSGDRLNMAFASAAEVLEEAAGMPEPPVAAFVNWSEALLNLQDTDAALKVLKGARKAFPDGHVELALQEGRVFVALAASFDGVERKQIEQREKARRVFRDAMEKYKQSAAACLRYGEMEVHLGNAEAANNAWREALSRDASAVDVGSMLQWLGNESSSRILGEHITAKGETPLLVWWRGYADYFTEPYLSHWDDAKQHFLRALELNPDFSNTWFFLGQGAMAKAQTLQSENKETAAREEYQLAADAWGKYLALYGPNHLQSLRQTEDGGELEISKLQWLGGKAYEWRDADASVSIARWMTTAKPGDSGVWNNLAFLLRETRQYEESYRAYHRADELKPDDPQVLNDKAVILHYYLQRDLEQAAGMYERAIVLAKGILEQADSMEVAERERIQIALRDANNNLQLLRGGHEEEEEGGEEEVEEAGEAG